MSDKYSHLLSPLKIGNVILKNRMLAANALPHFLQGPETFPAEPLIMYLSNLAKNGAAIVTFADWTNRGQRESRNEDGKRFPMFDIDDPSIQNYLSQLADAVHFYDSKLSLAIMAFEPKGYSVCDIPALDLSKGSDVSNLKDLVAFIPFMFEGGGPIKEMTEELIEEMIEDIAIRTKYYQSLGFDMCTIHMAYCGPLLARFLSPLTNKRTDKYGGSLENRARAPLAVCQRIKEVCGQDFLIEVQISGEEEGGITIEDTIAFAKMAEGKIDILQIRAGDALTAHPTGYNSKPGDPLTLRYAEAIKKSGAKIFTAPIGGFQNLEQNEEYIASGKTDLISMGRAFICDPDYFKKACEGRGDDVVPCIRCNKCHVPSMTGPWLSVCSVNPIMGIAHKVNRMIDPPTAAKKVAVIGGGPAGMKAAIVAAERGHNVTLYEKNGYLGGQLRHADFSSSKWPIRNFKDFLVRQVKKAGVRVLMNTEATPEMIKADGYDAVLLALGAKPNIPDIPGVHGSNVRTAVTVYGDHKSLGERVVVVGGSETGTETGMYLAQSGHKVTVLTRQDRLAPDATPIHYVEMVRAAWESMENFSYIVQATTKSIADGKVTYVDASGNEKTIEADSVVLSGGMTPLQDEALKFYSSADRFFIIGDCRSVGSIQTCMRSAFSIASQL
ncbi:MAG: FAD-dependent oxidoreductase [Firmicutes bacterium]|nr:FAD-dependent oxidoreductase [Bacillota bacterium]